MASTTRYSQPKPRDYKAYNNEFLQRMISRGRIDPDEVFQKFKSAVGSFVTRGRELYDEYNGRIENTGYRSDSGIWGRSVSDREAEFKNLYKQISDYAEMYKPILGDQSELLKEMQVQINDTADIRKYADSENKYWSQWADEGAYNKYLAEQEEYQKLLDYDLKRSKSDIDRMQSVVDNLTRLEREIAATYNGIQVGARGYANEQKRAELQSEYDKMVSQYGSAKDLANEVAQKTERHSLAQDTQRDYKYYHQELPDLKKYASIGSNASLDSVGKVNTKTIAVQGVAVNTEDPDKLRLAATALAIHNGKDGGKFANNAEVQKYLKEWKDEEFERLAYYIGKDQVEGTDEALTYLNALEKQVNYRKGTAQAERLEGKPLHQTAYGLLAGLDSFAQGISSLGSDEKKNASAIQVAGQKIREDLADNGLKYYNAKSGEWELIKINDRSTAQLVYELANTTGNMLPSILVSAAIELAMPTVGEGAVTFAGLTGGKLAAGAGALTLGASAGGNAKQEMLNLGYDKKTASAYGLMIGASEAGLSYVLSGIPGLRGEGGAFSALGKKIVTKIDNAIAKAAITLSADMLDEGLEEGIQTVLEPWFKSLVTGVDFEAPDIDEVLYSSLLGALSAAGFGGGKIVSTKISDVAGAASIGKDIKKEGKASTYIEKGLSLEGTKAGDIALKLDATKQKSGKVSNVKLGRLAQNMSASQMSAAFQSELGEDSRELSDTLTDIIKGKEVGDKRYASVMKNERALSLLNEALGTDVKAENSSREARESVNKALEATAPKDVPTGKISKDRVVESLSVNLETREAESFADTIVAIANGDVVSDKKVSDVLQNRFARNALNKYLERSVENKFTAESRVNDVRTAMVEGDFSRKGQAVMYGATFGMKENGIKGLVSVATSIKGDVSQISQAYNAVYQAGKQGKAITEAKNPYLNTLTPIQRNMAYEYGVMDSMLKEEVLPTEWDTPEEVVAENATPTVDEVVDEVVDDAVPEGGEKLKTGEVVVPVKEMTKEQSDLVEAGKKLGIEVIVASIKAKGKNIDGLYNGKALYVNPDPTSGNPLVTILKHELTHFLEKNTQNTKYFTFVTTVTDSKAFHKWLKDKGFKNTQEYLAEIVRNYKLVGKNYTETDPKTQGEMIANFVGDVLFAEDNSLERFVNELTEEKKKTFGDFIRDFINWIKGIFGKTDEVRMLEKKYAELFGSEKMPTESKETQLLFVGEKSNIADKIKLATAKQMLESGSDSETVRRETGWFKGYDGKWRFEIDDSDMEYSRHGFNPDYLRYKELELKFLEGTISDSELQELQKTPQDVKNINLFRLDQFVKHKALFDAYPELKRVKVSFDSNMADNGAFYPETFSIKINPKADDVRKTLLHEIQHAVQHIEEFATGGSLNSNISAVEKVMNIMGLTEDQKKIATISTLSKYSENVKRPVYDKLLKLSNQNGYQTVKEYIESLNAYSYYERIAGEIEARDVANRADMIAEERKNTRPDIDREDVVFADGVTYYKADAQKSKNTKTTEEEDEDVTSIKEQLREASDRLSLMTPISSKQSPRTFANAEETLKWAVDVLKSSGEIIQRKDYGDVILDEKRLKNGLSYLKTDMEKVAFSLVPKIIKNGIEIGRHPRHKGRNYDTITFASPVTVGDTTGYMAVVIREEGKKYYKLHRVFMPDGSLFVFQDKKRSNAETAGLQYANLSPTNGASNPIIPQNSNLSTPSDKNISDNSQLSYTPTKAERIAALVDQFEGGLITREQFEEQLIGKNKDDPISNARLTEEDANTTPDIKRKTGKATGDGERRTYTTLQKSSIFDQRFKDEVKTDEFIKRYSTITNEDTLLEAARELDEGGHDGVQDWLALKPERASVIDTVKGFILLDRYQRAGNAEGQVRVAQKLAEMGTAAGQTVQSFSILRRLDSAAMMLYAQKTMDDAYKLMVEIKSDKWLDAHKDRFKLNDEDIDYIFNRTVAASVLPDGRSKDVMIAQIAQRLQDKLPPEKGQTIKAVQRISMLLNPKTIIRNVLGNVTITPVHWVSDWVGTAADALIAKKTGVRTTNAITDARENAKAFGKGAFESYDDFVKKINTQLDLDRFDVRKTNGKSFDENQRFKAVQYAAKMANAMDRFTSFTLAIGDRPFYEYWFVRSINGQKKANKVDVPTADMIEIATQEALQRTWQDNNNFTALATNLKKVLNGFSIGGYGLGDVFLKFTKTPANLCKAIYDFSPAAFVSVTADAVKFKQAYDKGQGVAQAQKRFVKTLSNAVAGTMLYVGAVALFKAGRLAGGADEDKDVAAFEKWVQGIPAYSIKVGGRWFSYEWMQPIGSVAAIVSDFMDDKNEDAKAIDRVVEAIRSGGNVLFNQSFLQSFQRLFTADNFIDGLVDAIVSDPSAFVPQISSQFANLFDDTRRTTYDKSSAFDTFLNSIKYKIPGLRNTLTEDVDVFGRDVPNSQSKVGNAFFNPANTYVDTSDEVTDHVYGLYKRLGNKNMIPAKAPYSITVNEQKINLSTEERAEYQRIMGSVAYKLIEALLQSDVYNSYSDVEKEKVIKDVYSYANKVALANYNAEVTFDNAREVDPFIKRDMFEEMTDEEKQELWRKKTLSAYEDLEGDDESGVLAYFENQAVTSAVRNATIRYDAEKAKQYIDIAVQNAKVYSNSEDAEKDMKTSIRSYLTTYWKPMYQVAYSDGDKEEMEKIQDILESIGLYGNRYDTEKTLRKWLEP